MPLPLFYSLQASETRAVSKDFLPDHFAGTERSRLIYYSIAQSTLHALQYVSKWPLMDETYEKAFWCQKIQKATGVCLFIYSLGI